MARLPQSLCDFDPGPLAELLASRGIAPSHADKFLCNFYKHAGRPNLDHQRWPNALRALLAADLPLMRSVVVHQRRAGDGTVKLLLKLADGQHVESVLMPAHRPDRAAGCISSQVGCAMGCDFCASGVGGLVRNLSSGEIVEQYLHLRQIAESDGRRLQTVVFMGMGEPLHNLDNVIAAIGRIAGQRLGQLGWRNVTVSTVGIVPGIRALAESGLGVGLAISLHAPDDELRAKIIPTARRYKIADILEAAADYRRQAGREVNIEYTLLRGINDADEQARLLGALLAGRQFHLNLIPCNPIDPAGAYQRPDPARILAFARITQDAGVVAHIRQTRGDDITAACGQLARRSG